MDGTFRPSSLASTLVLFRTSSVHASSGLLHGKTCETSTANLVLLFNSACIYAAISARHIGSISRPLYGLTLWKRKLKLETINEDRLRKLDAQVVSRLVVMVAQVYSHMPSVGAYSLRRTANMALIQCVCHYGIKKTLLRLDISTYRAFTSMLCTVAQGKQVVILMLCTWTIQGSITSSVILKHVRRLVWPSTHSATHYIKMFDVIPSYSWQSRQSPRHNRDPCECVLSQSVFIYLRS